MPCPSCGMLQHRTESVTHRLMDNSCLRFKIEVIPCLSNLQGYLKILSPWKALIKHPDLLQYRLLDQHIRRSQHEVPVRATTDVRQEIMEMGHIVAESPVCVPVKPDRPPHNRMPRSGGLADKTVTIPPHDDNFNPLAVHTLLLTENLQHIPNPGGVQIG